MNQERVREVVDAAESAAVRAFQFLSELKDSGSRIRMSPHEFQVLLAEAIFALREVRSEVARERRELIRRKPRLSHDWFLSRARVIGRYCGILDSATSTLTNIGNVFAWLFYWHRTDLLREHLSRPKQVLSPGVGGLGELTFIRGAPHVHGMPVLAHMITSILRVGDVTLVDPTTRGVTALGEIKTAQAGRQELTIRLEIVGKDKDLSKQLTADPTMKDRHADPIWPPLRRRLERQVREMVKVITCEDASTARHDIRSSYYTDELAELGEALAKRAVAFIQAGPSLLLLGIRNSARRSLWSRLQGGLPAGFERNLASLPRETMSILDRESALNSLYQGTLDGTYFPGGTPLWWWPVDTELLRNIYLGRVVVVAIYNPARLVAQLLEDGFVSDNPTARDPAFHLAVGEDRQLTLGNFSYWISSIMHHLAKEETVIEIIRKATQYLISTKPTATTRLDIAFNQFLL